ncbi:ferrochelatase [soil metagenome]
MEPPVHRHGSVPRSAVLLVNLGTPDEATPKAVRRYLAEFLSDRRVVEINPWLWKPLLHGVILPLRAKASAARYASIWMSEGSPLRVWTEKQAKLLQGSLYSRGYDVPVLAAMRYGQPSVESAMLELAGREVDRLLVLPLYPQYCAATTATAFDAVNRVVARLRNPPEIRMVKHYHDEPLYIEALVGRLRAHFEQHGQPDRLMLSFHGMPQRTLELGDPYYCECLKTARLVAERMGFADGFWSVAFQSRFGKARWLQPYAAPTLVEWARAGVGRVDVICPGFVADCVETLEEIAIEAKRDFLAAGGREFRFITCLNDRADWIGALTAICEQHGKGWLRKTAQRPALEAAAGAEADRARAAGAGNAVKAS